MKKANHNEYGGFVKNIQTGQYELLFCTEFSELLARNRAIENARAQNELTEKPFFDTTDVIVKTRTAVTIYSDWEYGGRHDRHSGEEKEKGKTYSIAIDGPAAAGKTTLAKKVAQELGFTYIDTGAMYRALAYHMKNTTGPRINKTSVHSALNTIDIDVVSENGTQIIYLNSEKLRDDVLRTPDISKMASEVSAYKEVRQFYLQKQRDLASQSNVVMEGRDIGTVVLPNATVKIYLTADLLVRAQRRYLDLLKIDSNTDPIEVVKALAQRDYDDSHRTEAPLKAADDSLWVDSTLASAKEIADLTIQIIRNKMDG